MTPPATNLRFRQVHLDFHTSPHIPRIGEAFNKEQWQETLREGHVDSITCFATCHHGWSYYDTKIGQRHPNLSFDLLRAQMDASKEIGINVPVYLTAGFHVKAAHEHPEWRQIQPDGKCMYGLSSPLEAGYGMICFNSPFVDHLCAQIEEVVTQFPEANGIFLDIIAQGDCCCQYCLKTMAQEGLDAEVVADRKACAERVLERYYQRATTAARINDPEMPISHNSGHVRKGSHELLKYFSHLELESLPTGGWGYDHFPVSAKYCANLGLEYLGMTGKFHTTWGEFGGFKHPNALRYECAAMLAMGAKCSVGDQLHPSGALDKSTYRLIGSAYAEVEEKEPWCRQAKNIADVGLLSSEAVNRLESSSGVESHADVGAARMLLEGHFLFDVLDEQMDFAAYRVLILPDDVVIGAALKQKLDDYLAAGGKLLLTGTSALDTDGKKFLFDLGAEIFGESEFRPEFVLPREDLRPASCDSPMVMYMKSQRIKATDGESLGDVYDPYFNRSYKHFCSHQHAPAQTEPSGYAAGVRKGGLLYLAHPIFSIYRAMGAVAYKKYALAALNLLLAEDVAFLSNLPSSARVTLTHQPEHNRYVLHLLHATPFLRGGAMELSGGTISSQSKGVEVIEDIIPLHHVEVSLRIPGNISAVMCVPSGEALAFEQKNGRITFVLSKLECHQMIEVVQRF